MSTGNSAGKEPSLEDGFVFIEGTAAQGSQDNKSQSVFDRIGSGFSSGLKSVKNMKAPEIKAPKFMSGLNLGGAKQINGDGEAAKSTCPAEQSQAYTLPNEDPPHMRFALELMKEKKGAKGKNTTNLYEVCDCMCMYCRVQRLPIVFFSYCTSTTHKSKFKLSGRLSPESFCPEI